MELDAPASAPPWLSAAAAGIVAAAAVELLAGRHHSRAQAVGHCLLAGGLAAVYAAMVPARDWGAYSGARFAGRGPVARLAPPAPRGWGALTGLLLRLAA